MGKRALELIRNRGIQLPQTANMKSLSWRLHSWKFQIIKITFRAFSSARRQKSFGCYSQSQCYNEISHLIHEGKTFINQNINTKNGIVKSIGIPAVVSKLSVVAVWKHSNIYHYFRILLLIFITFLHKGGKIVSESQSSFPQHRALPLSSTTFF